MLRGLNIRSSQSQYRRYGSFEGGPSFTQGTANRALDIPDNSQTGRVLGGSIPPLPKEVMAPGAFPKPTMWVPGLNLATTSRGSGFSSYLKKKIVWYVPYVFESRAGTRRSVLILFWFILRREFSQNSTKKERFFVIVLVFNV